MRTMAQLVIRPMREEDIPQLVQLEQEAFPDQGPGISFHQELRNRLASYIVACQARSNRVADGGGSAEGQVLGYAGLWFVLDEAHLISIAVGEAHQRQGVGHQLLTAALELAREKAAIMMALEVRVSNTSAQALYEKFGFKRVGVRRGYYTDNHEDAYLMTVEHIDSSEYFEHLERLRTLSPQYSDGD